MGVMQNRFDQDMEIRGLSIKTRKRYIECVKAFVDFFGRPPGRLGPEEIRTYQLYLIRERARLGGRRRVRAKMTGAESGIAGYDWSDDVPGRKASMAKLSEKGHEAMKIQKEAR